MAGKTKRVSEFSWSKVDAALVRSLLRAAYVDAGKEDEARKVRSLSDKAARATAQTRLGEPPTSKLFSDSVYGVLRSKWLPGAKAPIINKLTTTVRTTLSGAALKEPVNTKPQQVTFLQSRHWTDNMRTNFRKCFIRAHRVYRTVEVQPSQVGPKRQGFELVGSGATLVRPWFPHQATSQARLDELWGEGRRFGARLVLPTGAGKTDTVVGWLLPRLAEDEDLRVLWLVHQQELAQQAMSRFRALVSLQPSSLTRRGRVIHSTASSVATLSEESLCVAAVTYQSLSALEPLTKKALTTFLSHPTIVVVDEAHHAGAPSLHSLLDFVEAQPSVRAILGLTATPYPSSPGARLRFRDRFPTLVHEESVGNLIRSEVLARPVVTTVDTGAVYELTDAQVARATSSDIPLDVLGRLDELNRNRLIVETWRDRAEAWGKTLVFATSIEHANNLTEALRRAGAEVQALHSATRDRLGPLDWFRCHKGAGVLVSVGMLTEGVDLPDARTAFLARPTTSPILMRQMVGRVLRGPKAGGEAEAHVVYFRDEWSNLPDVLYPEEVLPDSRPAPVGRDAAAWVPGPIVDDDQLELRADLAAQIAHAFDRLQALFNVDDDDPFNDLPPEPLLRGARIVGFYDLIEIAVPVFEHQQPGYEALLADALGIEGLRGTSFLSYFDDAPPPYPSLRALKGLVGLAREFGEVPVLEPLSAQLGPGRVAQRILDAGALTPLERFELVHEEYERSLNRVAYRTVEAFEEAVDQQLRELHRPAWRLDAEAPTSTGVDPASLPRLPRTARDLEPVRRLALETARRVLPPALARRLASAPDVRWTNRAVKTTWAHWSLKMAGKGRGKALIRVNRLLRTQPKLIPDDLLAYLVFHEMLHHLLPGQGHDAEFRGLEALWPDAERFDLVLDTLHERWDLRPERYRADVES